jgi:hypothetical protein
VTELGGRLVPASGSGLEKGDGRVDGRFRIETKRPPTRQYRLTYKDWEKIRDAAVMSLEIPVFHLVLGDTEFIILRDADYVGLDGRTPGPEFYTPTGMSFRFTEDSLQEVTSSGEHLLLWLRDPKKPTRSFLLRAMYRSDFVALTETQ